MAQLNAAEALDGVFDLLGRMEGFFGDLARGLFLDQAFVADNRLVGHGWAQVVNGAALSLLVKLAISGDENAGAADEEGDLGIRRLWFGSSKAHRKNRVLYK